MKCTRDIIMFITRRREITCVRKLCYYSIIAKVMAIALQLRLTAEIIKLPFPPRFITLITVGVIDNVRITRLARRDNRRKCYASVLLLLFTNLWQLRTNYCVIAIRYKRVATKDDKLSWPRARTKF